MNHLDLEQRKKMTLVMNYRLDIFLILAKSEESGIGMSFDDMEELVKNENK